ncbi:MAG: L-dopachrome tautomerase-related protein [Rikenellaceae bacterium]
MNLKQLSAAMAVATLSLGSCVQSETTPIAEVIFANESFIPGNIAIADNGDMFFSVNPLLNPDIKLYRVSKGGTQVTPYPTAEYVVGDDSIIEGVLGIKIEDDELWMLDMLSPKFVVWDIKSDILADTISIPNEVLRPNSFLQDFVIDDENDRVIIADMTLASDDMPSYPAFIVYDMKSRTFRRMAERHPSMLAEVAGGYDLNPIAIGPDDKWIYFGAMNGRKIYRVPADAFSSERRVISGIEYFSDKPFSDGIAVDDDGNVYIANIEDNTIAVSNKSKGFTNIATLPEGQSYPDGLVIEDDFVYATVSQHDKSAAMNQGKSTTQKPYVVVRTEVMEEMEN